MYIAYRSDEYWERYSKPLKRYRVCYISSTISINYIWIILSVQDPNICYIYILSYLLTLVINITEDNMYILNKEPTLPCSDTVLTKVNNTERLSLRG